MSIECSEDFVKLPFFAEKFDDYRKNNTLTEHSVKICNNHAFCTMCESSKCKNQLVIFGNYLISFNNNERNAGSQIDILCNKCIAKRLYQHYVKFIQCEEKINTQNKELERVLQWYNHEKTQKEALESRNNKQTAETNNIRLSTEAREKKALIDYKTREEMKMLKFKQTQQQINNQCSLLSQIQRNGNQAIMSAINTMNY